MVNRERTPRRIGILVVPHFSNLGLSSLLEPMAVANWLSQATLYEWRVLSTHGNSVTATNGMSVPTQAIGAEDVRYSTIFVVASFDAKSHSKDRKLKVWLQRQSLFGAQLAGIETGTELLAAASLLEDQTAAVHWDNLEGFQEAYPRIKACAQLYSIGARVMTCAGATAIMDMMLEWIARHQGRALAEEIAQHLLISTVRGTAETQLLRPDVGRAHMSEEVRAVIQLMRESMTSPRSCSNLAASVGLSKRQLERQFKIHTATAPGRYYVNLRVSTAHKLLQQTDLSVSQVAAATGFDSLEHFSRTYKTRFGRPPSLDRAQSWSAPVMRWHPVAAAAVAEAEH